MSKTARQDTRETWKGVERAHRDSQGHVSRRPRGDGEGCVPKAVARVEDGAKSESTFITHFYYPNTNSIGWVSRERVVYRI